MDETGTSRPADEGGIDTGPAAEPSGTNEPASTAEPLTPGAEAGSAARVDPDATAAGDEELTESDLTG